MTTIYDPRYIQLINHLQAIRKQAKVPQAALATALGIDQSVVSKVESFERRIDIMELHDWLTAIGYGHKKFLEETGWMQVAINTSLPAVPVPGKAAHAVSGAGVPGTNIEMAWQGQRRDVFIERLPVRGYLALEASISKIYKALNVSKSVKNREAIFEALSTAIDSFPDVNPSDLYHHVVYRVYLRDYTLTQADRSWVRAGGEAFELFLQNHYNQLLNPGIHLEWLKTDESRKAALEEMGIHGEVGGSKLDIALYGKAGKSWQIFGGLHAKASLAERVSDDVPCSLAMMRKGMVSYLVTLDAKSFPPPNGDLVNRGELGSPDAPSDKRNYVEAHGSFDACFSYNLRTAQSAGSTASGRSIFVSTFNPAVDRLPAEIVKAWKAFRKR